MNPTDFVYDQIFKGALAKKASVRAARDNAVMGLADYNKSRIPKKVSALIKQRIELAVKETKRGA